MLEAGGFALEARLDLMTCTPATVRRPPETDGLRFEAVEGGSPRELVRGLLSAQRGSFDQVGPPTDDDVERFSSSGILATLDGEPVAGGVFTAPDDGLSELAGIGTLPPFRRRGIAAALTSALASAAFGRGVEIAFLTSGDGDTRRVYGRAGFAVTSTMLAYARGEFAKRDA